MCYDSLFSFFHARWCSWVFIYLERSHGFCPLLSGWACQLGFFYVFSPSFSFFLYWPVGLVWLRLSSEASVLCLWLGFSLFLFCSSSFGPFLCGWASPFIFLLHSSLLSSTVRPFLFSWASPSFFILPLVCFGHLLSPLPTIRSGLPSLFLIFIIT